MARPKVSVKVQWSSTLPRAEGLQATATALQPSTESIKHNNNQVSYLTRPPRTQQPAVQVPTEQNRSPALGEKLLPEIPISATVSSTFPRAEGLQATAPAIWRSTRLAKEDHFHASPGQTSPFTIIQRLKRSPSAQGPVLPVEAKQNHIPAWASTSTAAVVEVEVVHAGTSSLMPSSAGIQRASASKKWKGERKASTVGKKPRTGRYKLSFADLVSDSDMRLKDKAEKLGVSATFFKNRRKDAGLGRWPGRAVRAAIKCAQAQARA